MILEVIYGDEMFYRIQSFDHLTSEPAQRYHQRLTAFEWDRVAIEDTRFTHYQLSYQAECDHDT